VCGNAIGPEKILVEFMRRDHEEVEDGEKPCLGLNDAPVQNSLTHPLYVSIPMPELISVKLLKMPFLS
jgi:hypothetical protein